MLPRIMLALLFFCGCWMTGCSENGTSNDAGPNKDADREDLFSNEIDPGPVFTFYVPEPIMACAAVPIDETNFYRTFSKKIILTFKPGTYLLSSFPARMDADPIENIEVGTGKVEAQPVYAGEFTSFSKTSEGGRVDWFDFQQEFMNNQAKLMVRFQLRFDTSHGAEPQPMELTSQVLNFQQINLWVDFDDERLFFSACSVEGFTCSKAKINLVPSDSLFLEWCYACPFGPDCILRFGVLKQIRFVSQEEQSLENSYFRLLHSYPKDGLGADWLIFMSQSLGQVRGFYLHTSSHPEQPVFTQVQYLNTSLLPLESRLVQDQETFEDW